jgi:hypothetical protein
MKNKNTNTVLGIAAVATVAYFVADFIRTKYDRIYRIAAGESFYEKTHHKKHK